MNNIRVRLPNGEVQTAKIGDLTGNGFRRAYARVTVEGERHTISGRITTRHGYANDRILPMQVKVGCQNADLVLTGEEYAA